MNDKQEKLQDLLNKYGDDLNPVKSKEEILEENQSKEESDNE